MSKDVAEQSVEEVEKGKRTRAKRPVYFYGIPAGTDLEEIKMPGESWNQAEAEAELRNKLGDDCTIIGPNYKVQSAVKKNNTSLLVKMDLRKMSMSGNQFIGHHAGWKFFAHGVSACSVDGESFDDDDLLHVQFDEPVGEKVPKPRVGRNLVRRSELDKVELATD